VFPGFIHSNHPNTVKKRGVDDAVDDRETPPDVYDPLHAEFGFTLDVAAARHNAKCKRYYALGPSTPPERRQGQLFPTSLIGDPEALGYDGLAHEWSTGEVIWCNPPFSDLEPWIAKARHCAATVVMLLPANRSEQPAWQEHIEPFRDGRAPGGPEVRFLPGRRSFLYQGEVIGNSTSKAPPFGIAIVIWDRRSARSGPLPRKKPKRKKTEPAPPAPEPSAVPEQARVLAPEEEAMIRDYEARAELTPAQRHVLDGYRYLLQHGFVRFGAPPVRSGETNLTPPG
jgi:hypothetical protein